MIKDDLISRNALLNRLQLRRKWLKRDLESFEENDVHREFAEGLLEDCQMILDIIIPEQKAVNALPVVRCKDCKHWQDDYKYCRHLDWHLDKNWFCGDGERKENE